jgi:hypothetical protein
VVWFGASQHRWGRELKSAILFCLSGLRALALLAAVCGVSGVAAQTIESIEWVSSPEGAEGPVARIAFAANVRYLRQVPRGDQATDRTQLSFQLVAADELVLNQVIEEGRRLAGRAGVPQIDLTYVPLATVPTKVLTLRFATPVQVSVRQGPGARWIDLAFQATADGNDRLGAPFRCDAGVSRYQ